MTLKDRRLTKWTAMRAMGPGAFILRHGVVGWGLTSAGLFSIIAVLFLDATLKIVASAFVAFPAAGICWGAVMWSVSEREWKKNQNREPV